MMKRIITASILMILIASPSFALKRSDEVPTFSLQDSTGKEFRLGDTVGAQNKGKVNGLVLSFFASWCMPSGMNFLSSILSLMN